MATPDGLTLSEEPRADVARYDALRMVLPLLPALQILAQVRHAA